MIRDFTSVAVARAAIVDGEGRPKHFSRKWWKRLWDQAAIAALQGCYANMNQVGTTSSPADHATIAAQAADLLLARRRKGLAQAS